MTTGKAALWALASALCIAQMFRPAVADEAKPASLPSASLDFDRTFASDAAARSASRQVYYEATYRLNGDAHRVTVWADRDARVKRRTDDAIETYLARAPGDIEWSMTVLDLKRHIRTDIDRTNLLRIGHFTDWFAQAHALARPQGSYRLTAIASGPPGVQPIAACRWYRLTQAERSTSLCWSAANRVPLAIVAADGTVAWRVTKLGGGPLPTDVFTIDDRGYVRNDANADIHAD